MGWICGYGAQRQTSAKERSDSQINRVMDEDMERPEITHTLSDNWGYLPFSFLPSGPLQSGVSTLF